MEKYYGNYLSIVVSEDGGDPERRGRVQIWIPGITNTLYGGWNDDIKNKDIYYIGDDSGLSHYYVEKLRAVLPWAECASPLIGGGTPLYYNQTNSGSYQESTPYSPYEEDNNKTIDFDTTLPEMDNLDGESNSGNGESNSDGFEAFFVEPTKEQLEAYYEDDVIPPTTSLGSGPDVSQTEDSTNGTISVDGDNPSGGDESNFPISSETPQHGEGRPEGVFSVPKCGSRVWVFFHGGDIQKPVYFAYSLAPTDHQNFYGNPLKEPTDDRNSSLPVIVQRDGQSNNEEIVEEIVEVELPKEEPTPEQTPEQTQPLRQVNSDTGQETSTSQTTTLPPLPPSYFTTQQ
jgi:hypothetical protein